MSKHLLPLPFSSWGTFVKTHVIYCFNFKQKKK